jgi:hypothetical protein
VTELSNLLRERLAGGPGAGVRSDSHPDADTLTAYVERLLPAAERSQVLEHLAVCAHCREVTILAYPDPAQEQGQQVAAGTVARRWGFLWNPGFIRATVSLAAVVVIATVVFQFRERPAEQSKTASYVAPTSGVSAEKDKETDKKDNAPSAEVARLEPRTQPSANAGSGASSIANRSGREDHITATFAGTRAAASPAAEPSVSGATDANGLALMAKAAPPRRDYVNSDFFANSMSADGAAVNTSALNVGELPTAPSPRVSNQVLSNSLSINAANTMDFAGMPTRITGTQVVRTQAPPSGSSSHWGLPKLSALESKAKKVLTTRTTPAIPPVASTAFAMGGPGQLNPGVTEAAAAAPTLDGASGLEQSGAFARRAMVDSNFNAKAEIAPNGWRISSGRLVRAGEAGSWVEACPESTGVAVTTFAVHGNELWAGGANTALLHSRDGGATCEQVTLGASASGSIVHIEARGVVVQVKSSSGQSWSSLDGGKTWKMDE